MSIGLREVLHEAARLADNIERADESIVYRLIQRTAPEQPECLLVVAKGFAARRLMSSIRQMEAISAELAAKKPDPPRSRWQRFCDWLFG